MTETTKTKSLKTKLTKTIGQAIEAIDDLIKIYKLGGEDLYIYIVGGLDDTEKSIVHHLCRNDFGGVDNFAFIENPTVTQRGILLVRAIDTNLDVFTLRVPLDGKDVNIEALTILGD